MGKHAFNPKIIQCPMTSYCFILTQSLESPGGTGRYFPLAKALVKKGNSVEIVALHHDYKNADVREYTIDGVKIYYVGQMHVLKQDNKKTYFGTLPLIWILLKATMALTLAAMRSCAAVMVVCKPQPMNTIAALSVKYLKKKAVFVDADDYETLNNRFKFRWQQIIVSWFERLAYRKSDLVFVVNTYLYALAQKFGVDSNKIVLLPHGYDRERFNVEKDGQFREKVESFREDFNIPADYKVVLFVGSLSLLTHAIDLLIQAFKIVLGQIDHVILVLAGRGEDSQSLMGLAKELGIETHSRFVGYVDPTNVPYLFGLSYLSCDPKQEGELPDSTLSLKLIESIASGIPCITADVGDAKMILDGAGIAVPPGSPVEFASAMLKLLQDEALWRQMQIQAQQIRGEMTWDHMADLFVLKYEQFTDKH